VLDLYSPDLLVGGVPVATLSMGCGVGLPSGHKFDFADGIGLILYNICIRNSFTEDTFSPSKYAER
jgi:hypothetical protein